MRIDHSEGAAPLVIRPEGVVQALGELEALAEQLHARTSQYQRLLAAAAVGDPRQYLTAGLEHGAAALGSGRRAELLLRDTVTRGRLTLTAIEQADARFQVAPVDPMCSPGSHAAGGSSSGWDDPIPEPDDPGDDSTEGIWSFLTGAIAGDLSNNTSWSAIGGQTIVGFIPFAGQAADVRDISAAGKRVYDGEDGAGWNLGISIVAVIPGLDFLKGGSRAGRKVLTDIFQAGLSQVSQEGMEALSKKLSKEAVDRASKEAVVLTVAREEMLVRLRMLRNDPHLSTATHAPLEKAHNALRDHVKQDDLVGALQDIHGIPVIKHGKVYNHLNEVNNALGSLRNVKEALIKDLKRLTPGTDSYRQISKEIEALAETHRRIKGFLEIK